MKKTYAGIGSRETPDDICLFMCRVAKVLEAKGYTLRSGGAGGADMSFEYGVSDLANMEIYLPWEGFNDCRHGIVPSKHMFDKATELAEKYHPAWNKCSSGAKKLLSRNMFQILGPDLNDPCSMVICWTKDGKASGGTGQALRLAEDYKIPIYNIRNKEDLKKVASMCLLN